MFVASTEFSLGQSLLSTDDIVKIVKDNDLKSAIITDTMSVTSLIPLAEKLGERLVIGVRMTLVEEALQERQPIYQPKVYPLDDKGMEVLFKYLSKAYERPYFYEQPRLDFEAFYKMLLEAPESFRVSTGDVNSLVKHHDYPNIVGRIDGALGQSTILDIIPVPSPLYDKINHRTLSLISDFDYVNIQIPAFYKSEDADVFPIHYSINKNVEFNYLKPSHKLFHYDEKVQKFQFVSMLQRLEKRYGFTLSWLL
jgi:DNA polymerase III alpha subunit